MTKMGINPYNKISEFPCDRLVADIDLALLPKEYREQVKHAILGYIYTVFNAVHILDVSDRLFEKIHEDDLPLKDWHKNGD